MEKYHWFKTEWHVKFENSMQVNGLCVRSRQAYTRALRMLVEYFDKTQSYCRGGTPRLLHRSR